MRAYPTQFLTIIVFFNDYRRALQERNALLGAGESLIREISKLKTDLETQNKRILDGGEGAAMKALQVFLSNILTA